MVEPENKAQLLKQGQSEHTIPKVTSRLKVNFSPAKSTFLSKIEQLPS